MAWLLSILSIVAVAPAAHAVRGQRAMVAADQRLASEAGVDILRRGGNAVDAAVATALVVGVVNPSSCGMGGGGFMLTFDRKSGEVSALDYRESAPAAAARDLFVRDGKVVPGLSLHSGLAVAVPGEVAGLTTALARFGTLPLDVVAAPAIAYARDGFPVEAHLAAAIERHLESIRQHPQLAATFLHADGTPLRAGEILRQPHLARTLEQIVGAGAAAFYEGPIGAAIVRTVDAAGGVMTRADLASYRPVWRRPVQGEFRGYRVYSMPPPSSGGGVLVTILNVIEQDDLAALGHNSPTYLHLLSEAMQFAFADRASAYGDPDFVDVPLPALLSPARAREFRHRLSATTTFPSHFYGDRITNDDSGTSHLSVIDSAGNAVACTTSINTGFGSMLVAGNTGVILNNTMDDFSAQPGVPNTYGLIGSEANAIAPGKRPLSSMTPTIVVRDGRAVAVAGASGGPFIITGTLQALLNTLVFGHDAETAVAMPRFHHQWTPAVVMFEERIRPIDRQALRRLGHRDVEVSGIGAVQVIRRAPDGSLEGASDPRKGGQAAAW